jgi:hypothetical protein
VALVGAFGGNTPVYPFLRDHLPLLGSFRFPAKYLVVGVMAVAATSAAGWDAMRRPSDEDRRARAAGVGLALAMAAAAAAVVSACVYATTWSAFRIFDAARALGARDPLGAAETMLRELPGKATFVLLLALVAATLLFFATTDRRDAGPARYALFALIIGDLLVHAWGVNPVFDASYLGKPAWMAFTRDDPDARFYVGGKVEGTLYRGDPDSSRAFLTAPGLSGSASRAALSNQAAFYPSAWRRREMLSYDLAILWPLQFQIATDRFMSSGREARDRFLDRTGVRYRILPPWQAKGRVPLTPIPYFLDSQLYDWGRGVAPRASVVPEGSVLPDPALQIEKLFEPGWDRAETVLVEREPPRAGTPGEPAAPFARIVDDQPNRVAVEAAADAGGGYLVLLDSYSPDWHVTVDGQAAEMVRADALFRAVRLAPGRHAIAFVYRPSAFFAGAGVSAAAFVVVVVFLTRRRRRVVS